MQGGISADSIVQIAVCIALTLLVGPESGWSAPELALAQAAGAQAVALGPRILRTETAGVAGIVALTAVIGDMQ